MIGDDRYTEALERRKTLVEERCVGVEALAEAGVELPQVRMQT